MLPTARLVLGGAPCTQQVQSKAQRVMCSPAQRGCVSISHRGGVCVCECMCVCVQKVGRVGEGEWVPPSSPKRSIQPPAPTPSLTSQVVPQDDDEGSSGLGDV